MIIDRVAVGGIASSSEGVCWVQGDAPRPRRSRPSRLKQRPLRPIGLGQRLSRPVGRELLFFACARSALRQPQADQSNQKKAHPVLAPSAPAALRVRKSGRNFCKGHPCPLQKRRASMRAALRVVSAGLAAAVWGPKRKQHQHQHQHQQQHQHQHQHQQQQQQQQQQQPWCWCADGCLFGVLRRTAIGRPRCRSVAPRGWRAAQCGARNARRGLSC